MNYSLSRLRIPTLLGLAIIILGLVGAVYLVMQEQTLISKAAPDYSPQNLIISNLEDDSVSVSWQTAAQTTSFITYGTNSADADTALDDRDQDIPQSRRIHHVTLKNLTPTTTYRFKIVSGRYTSDIQEFTTASTVSSQNGFAPIIGSVISNDQPASEGIIYLAISGASIQSSVIKSYGNFIIPINVIRSGDSSSLLTPQEGSLAKLTAITPEGEAKAIFELSSSPQPVGILKVGEDLDLTIQPQATASAELLQKFDLNKDKRINSADHAIVLENFGRNPKERRADFNKDGRVDKRDLDLISEQINKLNGDQK